MSILAQEVQHLHLFCNFHASGFFHMREKCNEAKFTNIGAFHELDRYVSFNSERTRNLLEQ